MAIVLTRTIIEKNLSCVSFLSDNLFNFVHVSTIIWWMFCLVLMKAKVGASRCDLYHTDRRSSVQSKSFFFFKYWVGFEEKKKKRPTQAFQFLQLVVNMYFVPVKLFILEIKGKKKSILEKKLSGLSMWPHLDQVSSFGLLVVSSNFFFFFF